MGGTHDVEEYSGGSYVTHLIAGAIAGTAEHCGMFPVDTIKTHLQARMPGTQSARISDITRSIISRSGFTGLFRGLTAMAAGAGGDPGHHPFKVGAAGMVATLASEAVLCPTDAIKQRMQLHVVPDGVRSLYSGYTTTLTMNIPFQAIYFASYESLVKIIKGNDIKSDQYSPITHMLAGGGAGMVSAGITNPFDVARTRLQTQGETALIQPSSHCAHNYSHTIYTTATTPAIPLPITSTTNSYTTPPQKPPPYNPSEKPPPSHPVEKLPTHYRGMLHAMRTIWKDEGLAGYTRGIKPRMIFHSMSAAVS